MEIFITDFVKTGHTLFVVVEYREDMAIMAA